MRRDAERLQDILEALDSVAQMIAGRTEAEFVSDTTLCYAVAHRLTVVGEAAGGLSRALTDANPSVPWSDIVGLRNILVHQYFGIHWPLVWKTASDDAPVLRSRIAQILEALGEGG
jgi:uncharacterized protein with HEPN domain